MSGAVTLTVTQRRRLARVLARLDGDWRVDRILPGVNLHPTARVCDGDGRTLRFESGGSGLVRVYGAGCYLLRLQRAGARRVGEWIRRDLTPVEGEGC